jgi:hypothetical protein
MYVLKLHRQLPMNEFQEGFQLVHSVRVGKRQRVAVVRDTVQGLFPAGGTLPSLL